MFKKQPGTAGILGQLYETNLIATMLFRAKHDDNIEEFYLASNLHGVGKFDDICFKAKIRHHARPLLIFLQAKHKEDNSVAGHCISDNELIEYFKSYIKIKENFNSKIKDDIFNENFDDNECIFIVYTNKKTDDNCKLFENEYARLLNTLIGTRTLGSQAVYTEKEIKSLSNILVNEEMVILAKRLAKYIEKESIQSMMLDNYIQQYHVLLAKHAFEVISESDQYKTVRFQKKFFENKNKFLSIFRINLYLELYKLNKENYEKLSPERNIDKLNAMYIFLKEPSVTNLSLLIGRLIYYNNDKLEVANEVPAHLKYEFEKIRLTQHEVNQAIEIVTENKLATKTFKVALTFGNDDLILRGNERLNYIKNSIVEMIKNSKPNKVIVIDDRVQDGILKANGGIGSAIGNVLIYDETTRLIKFNDSNVKLKANSNSLLTKLKEEINNLDEYRIDIKVNKLPKLTFDCDNHVKEFLSKLVFYTDQANEKEMENILKKEIEEQRIASTANFRTTSEGIYLKFHNEIQKWWLLPRKAEYLTKQSNIYEQVVDNIKEYSLLNIFNMMYLNRIKNIKIIFNETATGVLKALDSLTDTIIVTEIPILSSIKVLQCIKTKNYVVLDLKYILNMKTNEYSALNTELMNSNAKIIMIIIFNNSQNIGNICKRLENIAEALYNKNIIVVTNYKYVDTIKLYFPQLKKEVSDGKHSLIDFDKESQIDIIENAQILFQGIELGLESYIDSVSIDYIQGEVLNDIIHNKSIVVGEPLSKYDNVKSRYSNRIDYIINKENDNLTTPMHTDDIIVIGGTSRDITTLTHFAFATKMADKLKWVIKINLKDDLKIFSDWQKNKTIINNTETIRYLCRFGTSRKFREINHLNDLTEASENVYSKSTTGNGLADFEINMFLHYYKTKTITFLFDGIEDIYPNYFKEMLTVLKNIQNHSQKHRIYIACGTGSAVISILIKNFSKLRVVNINLSDDTEGASRVTSKKRLSIRKKLLKTSGASIVSVLQFFFD